MVGGRQPLMEDDHRWKTTCGGRGPAVEDDLQRKPNFAGSLHAAYSALRHFYFKFIWENMTIFAWGKTWLINWAWWWFWQAIYHQTSYCWAQPKTQLKLNWAEFSIILN